MRWVLAIHIMAIICWYAGLFYLPRLFVYHTQADDDISKQRFCIMERRLLLGIMLPSSLLSLFTGSWLLMAYAWHAYQNNWWLYGKLICVALLFIFQAYCWKYVNKFKGQVNHHSHIFYRWFNEIPSVLLVVIVILVVVKP